ncbi:unnamed protein product [Phaeothamnion confervicola]
MVESLTAFMLLLVFCQGRAYRPLPRVWATGRRSTHLSLTERAAAGDDDGKSFEQQDLSLWDRLGRPRYVAAPMVDQSELPFRLLVRRHGVGLCYTPMIHSPTFSQPSASIIRRNAYDGGPSLAADRPLIAQLCGNDGATLVAAGRYIEHDVDAIDLNLGCPQGIARKGSYGAYLLEQDGGRKAVGLVRAMAEGLRCPVTVKMRRLETAAATVELARRLEDAGAQVVTLHGRTLRQAKTRQVNTM